MSLNSGSRIGPYEIVDKIGEGGMGQVYRATDTNLKRQVAIKVLPDALVGDADRLARFQREAELLASLTHPNIAAIYGLERQRGSGAAPGETAIALVMELIEGPTLADRIAQGPLPLEEVLPIATQIAEALEAAHEQGVIHRDLKPANIKVRTDGTVKVLDFGLAKAIQPASAVSASVSLSPTITSPAMTQAGIIIGTAAYMSPEQAKGRIVDKRSDVWAFGAVLYEMLTGRRAFEGDDVSETLAVVLMREPDWSALSPSTPPALMRLLRRSLEKDRRYRLPDMAMARIELRDVEREMKTPATAPIVTPAASVPSSRGRRVAPYAAAMLSALVAGAGVWWARRPSEEPRALMRFTIELPDGAQVSGAGRTAVAISPDGTHVAYGANQRLYLRALDQAGALAVPGTEAGGDAGYARSPFFSPDGKWLAFWQQGQLRKAAASGGSAMTIATLPTVPVGMSWGAGDEILMGVGDILRVPGGGGKPEILVKLEGGARAARPQALPGGEWILFSLFPAAANTEQGQAVVQSRKTNERHVLLEGIREAQYLPSGYLLFSRGNALLAQPFDVRRLALYGQPVQLMDGVANSGSTSPMTHAAVSSTGTLLYLPGSTVALVPTSLVLVAFDGAEAPLADLQGVGWFPRFSPNGGTRLAYSMTDTTAGNTEADLWVLDVTRGARTRATFGGSNKRYYPIWTRDGARLTFGTSSDAANQIASVRADGTGGVEILNDAGDRRFPTSWTPDGSALAFYFNSVAGTGKDATRSIGILRREGDKWIASSFVETPFEERGAIFSPDGAWVAYVSTKSGHNDVYAHPYPGAGSEITISVGGGQEPVWAPSGRELYYRHDGKILAVPIERTGETLKVGTPKPLFADKYRLDTGGAQGGMANFDISPDGKHFAMVKDSKPQGATGPVRLQMILNWTTELDRVPTR